MSPAPTVSGQERGGRTAPLLRYVPFDVFLVPPHEVAREIVVDWQLPTESDRRD